MPYVEGGDVPAFVYATTNATVPPFNDWTSLTPHQRQRFKASPLELETARQKALQHVARQAARDVKHMLFAAIIQRDAETCKRMLKQNVALLERHTPQGHTPLLLAAAVGDEVILSILLEMGASVTSQMRDGVRATPLILAASRGHTSAVQAMLNSKQGGNAGRAYLLRQCTKGGETAVMAAAKGGHLDTLKMLIAAGGDPGAVRLDGIDALQLACKHDRVSVAQFLMAEARMSPCRVDEAGMDALMHAAAGGAPQATELLLSLQHAPDVHSLDGHGLSAIHHACLGGNPLVVRALADNGAALDPADLEGGARLLGLGAEKGHGDVIQWLVNQGIGRDSLISDGDTNPLFAAVRGDSMAGVESLLVCGARLEVRDSRGRTPLAYAARLGRDRMVSVLASKGANLLAQDMHGRVPRQLAHLHRHTHTAQLLSTLARDQYVVGDLDLDRQVQAEEAARREAYGGDWGPVVVPPYTPGSGRLGVSGGAGGAGGTPQRAAGVGGVAPPLTPHKSSLDAGSTDDVGAAAKAESPLLPTPGEGRAPPPLAPTTPPQPPQGPSPTPPPGRDPVWLPTPPIEGEDHLDEMGGSDTGHSGLDKGYPGGGVFSFLPHSGMSR